MAERTPKRLWDDERLESPHDQPDKAARVRDMFDAIAPTYERVNAVFSAGRDAKWRRRAVELARLTPDDRVLDIACGTGDFARAFRDHPVKPRSVTACDFAAKMLAIAVDRDGANVAWSLSDALSLPFADGSFSVTSCAFGVRNFQDLDRGLTEMYRVLRPGGRAVVLEFTRPRNRWIRRAYELYASRIMPAGATWVSGDRTGAYRYLPRSVVSFDDAESMCRRFARAGFATATTTPLTLGVVTVYVACKSS